MASFERAKQHLAQYHLDDRVIVFDVSSATVELAALALGCEACHIAKTLSFKLDESSCVLIVAAGDARVDNKLFKAKFGCRHPKMLAPDEVVQYTGYAVGGVCPFAVDPAHVKVYLDISLKRFDFIYPACGSDNSGVRLRPEELETASGCIEWIDVCKEWKK